MKRTGIVLISLILLSCLFIHVAAADPVSLQRALEELDAVGPLPPLHMPAVPEAYLRLIERNGRLEELNLTRGEGLAFVEAFMAKQGIAVREPTWEPAAFKDPPSTPIRSAGEFERLVGVILHYPIEFGYGYLQISFNETLLALDGDPDVTIYFLVNNASQETQVKSKMTTIGCVGDNFEYYTIPTNTFWSRDYGPMFIEDLGSKDTSQSLVDLKYYFGRFKDDAVPDKVATQFSIPSYGMNLSYEGGNFMNDGNGTCFSSTGILTYNPGLTQPQVAQMMKDYLGCEKHIITQPLIGEGTTHIDMYAKLLDATTVMVGQHQPDDDNYERLENTAAQIAGETNVDGVPFEVIRVPMPPMSKVKHEVLGLFDVYRSYTNSLIVNNKVLVPTYNIAMDAQGMAAYENFYAGKDMEVISINSVNLINLGGAIHCVTMERTAAGLIEPDDDDDDDDDDNDTADDDDAADDDDDAVDDDDDNDAADDDDDDDDTGCCG